MYHFSNHQLYHQNTYPQQCPIFVEHTKHVPSSGLQSNHFEPIQQCIAPVPPEINEIPPVPPPELTNTEKKKKMVIKKSSVDTSIFSIEERLVAAVWVHERKNTKSSMSQIKHDFRQRFGREPPAKNTLLVWERKLFSTGSVHDAPRPGRPVNRRARMDEVAASVRSAPTLSLRARALALRVPRTTLRTILYNDLSHTNNKADTGQHTQTGKHQIKKNIKKTVRRKPSMTADTAGVPLARTGYT
ncbi:uncharacterized protein LOC142980697 [Anticarsia gemmatalis]|uniref:uncharacterized protein LOC142980697 n=1 Tax=Anticarsia gemmatalis TaxID=129554 RepID=UPI003F76BF39